MAGVVRQPIDEANLAKYIEANVPEIKLPVSIKQFGFGQSNPTYQLTDKTGQKYVLRKKPPGKLLSKTAHKVDREYRILRALEPTDVPTPKTYTLCQDESVIGTDFYIMEFMDGRIIEDPLMPGVSPEDRRAMWKDAVVSLAKFHRVDPKRVGLENFGKWSGFYNRQLATFNTIQDAQSKAVDIESGVPVGKIPYFDDMVAFFKDPKTQPKDRSSFVHGDYKIDNVVFHKTEPRVIGILDWEMATIGHPLSDLSNLLTPFTTANSETARRIGRASDKFLVGATPGLPTKEQCIEWYRQVAGWDPTPDTTWGDAFGIYRGSIIMQGIAARYAMRVASSANAKSYADSMPAFATVGWDLVQAAKAKAAEKAKQAKL
ncbi:APH-domain-containing protein [Aulographum hederae CBS 113979]|uniref:APH-domain-containing protein n=1 Tax=Aulographum hederae CBS 113979 TaxID=1176131 RepID=A0A6G1GZM7_9PEZI|nr:APH-domain-containing protein [Aulographum hederae CBS 113979]